LTFAFCLLSSSFSIQKIVGHPVGVPGTGGGAGGAGGGELSGKAATSMLLPPM